jgi:hypothetical protein
MPASRGPVGDVKVPPEISLDSKKGSLQVVFVFHVHLMSF